MEGGEPALGDEYSEKEIVEEIRRVAESANRQPPAKSDMDAHGRMSSMTAADRFGSWNDALGAAGYDEDDLRPAPADETTREAYIEAVDDLAADLGRPPNSTEFRTLAGHHDSTALKWFDSWEALLRSRGHSPDEMATATHQTRQTGEAVIDRVCDDLGLAEGVRPAAHGVWNSFCNTASPQGMGVDCLATASVAVAARALDAGVSLEDVFATTDTHHSMSSAYRKVARSVDVEVAPPDPAAFVEPVADNLDAHEAVQARAETLVEAYVDAGEHSGRSHWGIAGAALYTIDDAVGREEIRQKDAADAAGVCLVTIRSRWEELQAHLDVVELEGVPEPVPEKPVSPLPEEHDGDTAIVIEVDGECIEVDTASLNTQADAMIAVLRALDDQFNLFDVVTFPYVPGRCKRAFLTDDPAAIDDDRRYSWVQIDDSVYVDTKIDRGAKARRLRDAASEVGVEIRIPNAAAIGESTRGGQIKSGGQQGTRPDWMKAD